MHEGSRPKKRRLEPDRSATTPHDLIAVSRWLPGKVPADYDIDLCEGGWYEAQFWRCRRCNEERDRRDEFDESCSAPRVPTRTVDGGYSVDDDRTRRALGERMVVEFVRLGPIYRVESQSGRVYLVDVEAETCTCPDHTNRGTYCKHLRRVDLEIRVGTVPRPDGTFVR